MKKSPKRPTKAENEPPSMVVSLRLPTDLVHALDGYADAEGRSRTNALVRLLRPALDAASQRAG